MRKFVLTVVSPLLLFVPCISQTGTNSPAPNSEEQQLNYAETELLKAENENSRELFDRALSADFQALTPDGRTYDKAKVLGEATVRQNTHFPYRVEQSNRRVFRFGNAAVVTYMKQYIGTEGEAAGKIRKQPFIDVFTKESGGGWKLHFTKAEVSPESNESLAR